MALWHDGKPHPVGGIGIRHGGGGDFVIAAWRITGWRLSLTGCENFFISC